MSLLELFLIVGGITGGIILFERLRGKWYVDTPSKASGEKE